MYSIQQMQIMPANVMKKRDWWPVVPELAQSLLDFTDPVSQQGLGNGRSCAAMPSGTAEQETVHPSVARAGSSAALKEREGLGASWWTSQRHFKGARGSAVADDHPESLAKDAAMQDDSGPPTPESEDRASSLVACAAAGKMDAAAPVLNADDQRFATDMSTYGLARIGLPSPPYGRIPLTAAQEPQGVEVLYTGLFIGHAEQKKLFAR